MTEAYRTELGTLWRADALELLGSLETSSVDLVVADPPYAIAKESWDEFDSLEAYVDWCDVWLEQVHLLVYRVHALSRRHADAYLEPVQRLLIPDTSSDEEVSLSE